jgi:serine/threonine protein kinase
MCVCSGRHAGIRFQDLEVLRVIGTGQFGVVRIALHRPSGEVFALKARGARARLPSCPRMLRAWRTCVHVLQRSRW